MGILADADSRRTTICPACGYPSINLCAACSQMAQAMHAYQALQRAVPVVAQANPDT
jgi:hypothetical protein